jgi:hypothetical protein
MTANKPNSLRAVDLLVLASMLLEVRLHLTEEDPEDVDDGQQDDDLGGCLEEED